MAGHIKLAGLIAALLLLFFPCFTLAQDLNIGVVPAKVYINNLSPGQSTQFELTICNDDEIARVFTFSTCPPLEQEKGKQRAEFPDSNWISFSAPEIEVPANSQANVTLKVAIPPEPKWAGRDWEAWLGVTPESTDMFGVRTRLYVRLLVSTSGARFNIGLIVAIAATVVLLGYGGYYYFRHRAKCG
jgi:hypothetical protein